MTKVPRVALAPDYSIAGLINGCWQLTPDHGGGAGSDQAVLRRFAELVEHGFTTFDCADIYSGTEELLGKFRRSLPDPTSIQIHTKFVPDKGSLITLDQRRIDAVIDRSLRRLQTERLDLVQFHWWDYGVDGLGRLYERLLRLKEDGKIRMLGVTNFNTEKLQELLRIDSSLVAMQAQYSLLDRRPERSMLDCCREHDVALLAYGALAGGFISERYLHQPEPAVLNRSLQKYRLIIDETGGWAAFQDLLKLLDDIATKHESSISVIAARWVLERPTVAGVILGTGTRSRVAENLTIAGIDFDDEDRQRLRAQLDTQPLPSGEPYDIERDPDGVHAQILRTNLQQSDAAQ